MEEHVNHPDHYIAVNGMETIDVIQAYTANLNGVVAFDIGNALKYICRFTKKEWCRRPEEGRLVPCPCN